MNSSVKDTLSINQSENGCHVEIDQGARTYTVQSKTNGVLLKGERGRWAEIFSENELVYSITVGAEKDRVLRNADGEELVRWTAEIMPEVKAGEGDDPVNLLPVLDFDSPLPNAEHLALILCSEKM